MLAPVLTLANIRKSFGPARALRDASLELFAGQVTALVGENGAGKSTLVKVLCGFHQPDSGEIRLDGQAIHIADAQHARRLGINVVHQECVVFDNLTVAENIFIGARPERRGVISWNTMRRRAAAVLEQLKAPFDPDMPVSGLSVAQKHVVQIARALTSDARVVIMDEPTAALSHREAEDLFRITRQLRENGCAVLFISHRFEEIFALADRYAVFRDGESVGAGLIAQTTSEELIRLMVGRPVGQLFPRLDIAAGAELMRVEKLCRAGELQDISFTVRGGEILGIYGLVGAGRTELAQVLFGLQRADSGQVFVENRPVEIASAAAAMQHGIAYVPEDRQHEGAILPFSIADNIALANLGTLSRRGLRSTTRETALAEHWISALRVKATGASQKIEDLSGGNQQKVVLAKWLARNPRILILDEPTKGIDVGAKAAVHSVASEFAQRGNAVVMISSDLPEILGMSDRILVMRRGRVSAHFDRQQASAEAIVRAATSG